MLGMTEALSFAVKGLQTATAKLDRAAQSIALPDDQNSTGFGQIDDIIDVKVAEQDFKANLVTLKTVKELSDELLNVLDETV